MDYLLAILAGAVQGLTEFLPVSSTGHLIIFENLFGISQEEFGLAFDASLHLGTLTAILVFFAKDYAKNLNLKNSLLPKIIIATFPAVVFGLLLESVIETTFRQIAVVAWSLILFSPIIFIAEKYSKKTKTGSQINYIQALIIGLFQALALIPGVSRSGATISAGMFANLKREESAKFAFMLSGPIIAAAGLKKFSEVLTADTETAKINFFIIGVSSSAIFGYLTIKYFLKYLSTQTLYPFVIYRVALGLILLL